MTSPGHERWYDNPSVMAHVHSGGLLVWASVVPLAYFASWLESVVFVSALSILALALAHWAGRESATAQRDLDVTLSRIEQKLDAVLDSRHEDDS